MESYYEINVSLNGHHFFATAPRSLDLWNEKQLKRVLAEIVKRFPESEGFKITVSSTEVTNSYLDVESLVS